MKISRHDKELESCVDFDTSFLGQAKRTGKMRWDENHESEDIDDRRGQSGGGGSGVSGLFSLGLLFIRSPVGWVLLLIAGAIFAYGTIRRGLTGGESHRGGRVERPAGEERMKHFAGFVLDDSQATWTRKFAERRETYRRSKLVLFTGSTSTGCGYGKAATGPFYCPADERVYIDLSFYRELEGRLGARGEFAKAYVIAHEIGHHVQHLLGTDSKVPRRHAEGADGPSVRLELQADCYAGIWAHSTGERKLLEGGDIESALGAAAAIGDDRLQERASGAVRPESFTHGTSAQRIRWFKRGYEKGRMDACDTFASRDL